MKNILILFIITFVFSAAAYAQNEPEKTDTAGVTFYAYPYAFYEPETNIAFGGGGVGYYRIPGDTITNPSNLYVSAYYTINNQYEIILEPEVFFRNNLFYIKGEFSHGKFIDKFYGVGNDTPDYDHAAFLVNTTRLKLNFLYNSLDRLQTGILYEFGYNNVKDPKENILLNAPGLIEPTRSTVSGLGFSVRWDSRNSVFYPSEGGYYDFHVVHFDKFLGSDNSYTKYFIDLRQFYASWMDQIIAVNIYGNFVFGEAPLLELPKLGGSETMRGYFKGRFRDNQYFTGQIEYRANLIWRIRGILFLGAGQVAESLPDLTIENLKYSYGFGLRFILDTKENLDLRADLGFGAGTMGIYFSAQQAF